MRVAWLNNREFHTQFPPKKLNDWLEGTLNLVKGTVDDGFTPKRHHAGVRRATHV